MRCFVNQFASARAVLHFIHNELDIACNGIQVRRCRFIYGAHDAVAIHQYKGGVER